MSKSVKNAPLNFPEPKVTSSDCFFCQNNGPKYKKSSFFIIKDTEKQQILTWKRLNLQSFLLVLFEKWLKRLINFQNCWRLIFYRSINRFFSNHFSSIYCSVQCRLGYYSLKSKISCLHDLCCHKYSAPHSANIIYIFLKLDVRIFLLLDIGIGICLENSVLVRPW